MEEAGVTKYADEEDYEEECIDFDPYAFIKNLPPLKQVVPRWRRSLLPRQTRQCKRKTLVRNLYPEQNLCSGCDLTTIIKGRFGRLIKRFLKDFGRVVPHMFSGADLK